MFTTLTAIFFLFGTGVGQIPLPEIPGNNTTEIPADVPAETPVPEWIQTQEAIQMMQTEIVQTQDAIAVMQTQAVWNNTLEAVNTEQTRVVQTQTIFGATQTKVAALTLTPTPKPLATQEPTKVPTKTPQTTATLSTDVLFGLGLEAYTRGEYLSAFPYFYDAADQGDVLSLFFLGYMNYAGMGIPQNYETALRYFKKAADLGSPDAQNSLGFMYDYGIGVEQSYEKAVNYYQLAAEQGDTSAQFNLGTLYYLGNGVEQSLEKAANYFQTAADAGHSGSQNTLAYLYANGYGVEQSYETALKYYQLAADQNYAMAQYNLGEMYESGYGVEQSLEMALKYYQMAAAQGYSDAQAKIETLSNKTTPTETPKSASSDFQVGESVYFGNYKQGKNGEVKPIEWLILSVTEDKALLLSLESLEVMPYHNTYADVTWETSDIRMWLNTTFYEEAFTLAERNWILEVVNKNYNDSTPKAQGGNDTKDKVFLLSIQDMRDYLPQSGELANYYSHCRVSLWLKYNSDIYVYPNNFSSNWWLRSPGIDNYNAAYVKYTGDIVANGGTISYASAAIRPAIWISLK